MYDRNRGYIPLRFVTEQLAKRFRKNEVRYATGVPVRAHEEVMTVDTPRFQTRVWGLKTGSFLGIFPVLFSVAQTREFVSQNVRFIRTHLCFTKAHFPVSETGGFCNPTRGLKTQQKHILREIIDRIPFTAKR